MNKYSLTLLLICLVSCKKAIQEADLEDLNGYWEITKVEFPDGSKKEYGLNPSIDYIELENGKGFRKKVQPNLDGTYRTSNDAEQLEIVKNGEGFLIQYLNGQQGWEEVLIEISETTFIVENEENLRYHYKRYEPLNLD